MDHWEGRSASVEVSQFVHTGGTLGDTGKTVNVENVGARFVNWNSTFTRLPDLSDNLEFGMDVSAHGRKNNFVVESAWAAWQRLALQKLKSSVIRAETGGRQRCKRSVVQAETGLQDRKSSVVRQRLA